MSTLTGTPHFSLAEVQANTEWPIPDAYQANAQATLVALEHVRAVLGGGRLRLTSLYRTAAANAGLPGSATDSRHLTAQAVDVVPLDISLDEAARRWQAAVAARQTGAFDQFIIEQAGTDGLGAHIHYDPGGPYGHRMQSLVRLTDTSYQYLTDWIAAHPATSVAGVVGVALVIAFRPLHAQTLILTPVDYAAWAGVAASVIVPAGLWLGESVRRSLRQLRFELDALRTDTAARLARIQERLGIP